MFTVSSPAFAFASKFVCVFVCRRQWLCVWATLSSFFLDFVGVFVVIKCKKVNTDFSFASVQMQFFVVKWKLKMWSHALSMQSGAWFTLMTRDGQMHFIWWNASDIRQKSTQRLLTTQHSSTSNETRIIHLSTHLNHNQQSSRSRSNLFSEMNFDVLVLGHVQQANGSQDF